MARKKWKKKKRLSKKIKKEEPEPSSSNQTLIKIALIILIIGMGYYIFVPRSTTDKVDLSKIEGEFDIVQNKPNTHEVGKVEILEFFDFYCSHCYTLHRRIPALKKKYGDKIDIKYLGFPLGKKSFLPLEAYELAKEQGKGEEMKDELFAVIHIDNKEVSTIEALKTIAVDIGLDVELFEEGLKSGKKKQVVNDNVALANGYRIRQTPTLIFDGQIKTSNYSPENFDAIITGLLKEDPQTNS